MNTNGRLLVGWLIGWMVCRSVIISLEGGKLHFHAYIGALVDKVYLMGQKEKRNKLCNKIIEILTYRYTIQI